VPLEDVEAALVLALMAAESLHGAAQLRLDAAHYLDAERRACVVDASTELGRHLNQLFIGFLRRELEQQSFRVERLGTTEKCDAKVALANAAC